MCCHYFHFYMAHKAAKYVVKLISESYGDSQLSICLPMENEAI